MSCYSGTSRFPHPVDDAPRGAANYDAADNSRYDAREDRSLSVDWFGGRLEILTHAISVRSRRINVVGHDDVVGEMYKVD